MRSLRWTAAVAAVVATLSLVPAEGASAHHRPLGAWCGGQLPSGVFPVYCEWMSNLDGRKEEFWQGSDKYLWHRYQFTPGGSWSAWSSLGGMSGGMRGSPAVERYADGRLGVFVIGLNDGRIYHRWQNSAGGGWIPNWVELPGDGRAYSNPDAAHNADGRIQVFIRGDDASLYTNWKLSENGPWYGWFPLHGTLVSEPYLSYAAGPGRMRVRVRGTDDRSWYRDQVTASVSNNWTNWLPVP